MERGLGARAEASKGRARGTLPAQEAHLAPRDAHMHFTRLNRHQAGLLWITIERKFMVSKFKIEHYSQFFVLAIHSRAWQNPLPYAPLLNSLVILFNSETTHLS